jgi:hypothetical protein
LRPFFCRKDVHQASLQGCRILLVILLQFTRALERNWPIACAALLFVILALAWSAYSPGLSGGFIFDDNGTLPALGDFGPVDNWQTFIYYITSGTTDPLGRPLAMLTFLADANNWPADPASFKRTNVLLHLLNGVLLGRLLMRLGQSTTLSSPRVEISAIMGAGLWLLHPLWTSTTLYVVQREAMLAGTFVLIGLIAYLRGRRMIATRPLAGSIWIVGGVSACTAFGMLCKTNAILLPILVAVTEWVFLRQQPGLAHPTPALTRTLRLAIYPPVFGLAIYLAYWGVHGILVGLPSFRTWTLVQRLLTEPAVLLDYLKLLVVPRPFSPGLFNDDYPAAQDVFHPWTILPSLLAIFALLVFAIAYRKRWPAVALAISFFLAGHLLESTTLPLELYFEHRNYVPAMLLFWPIALWLTDRGNMTIVKGAITTGGLLLLFAETHAAASLWGDPNGQAMLWAMRNPESPRAQAYAASTELSLGHPIDAERRLRSAIAKHGDEMQLQMNLLATLCERGTLHESDIVATEHALKTSTLRGTISIAWIATGIQHVRSGSCKGLTLDWLQRLIDAAGENPHAKDLPRFQQSIANYEGRIALARGDHATAEIKFIAALDANPEPDAALSQAAILGSNGLPQAGLRLLDHYDASAQHDNDDAWITSMQAFHAWLLRKNGYWQNEMAHMRRVLTEDAQRLDSSGKHDS